MQRRITCRSLTVIMVLFGTVILLFGFPVQGQTSEVELIGMRKYPFSVVIDDQVLPERKKNRLNLSGLPPGALYLEIAFNDTTIAPVGDTLMLESGLCYVYRIVRDRELTDFVPSGGSIRRGIRRDAARRKPVFRLQLLEVVEAKQEYGDQEGDAGDTVNPGIVAHTTGYHFTRQEPVRVTEAKQSSAPSATDVDLNSHQPGTTPVASVPVGSVGLTEAQLLQLVQRLKGLRFEEERMQLIDQSLKQKRVTSQQLFELLGCFDFERSKVRIFKQYYTQLSDPEGHASLYRAFDFNSTIDELKHWVNEQR